MLFNNTDVRDPTAGDDISRRQFGAGIQRSF